MREKIRLLPGGRAMSAALNLALALGVLLCAFLVAVWALRRGYARIEKEANAKAEAEALCRGCDWPTGTNPYCEECNMEKAENKVTP